MCDIINPDDQKSLDSQSSDQTSPGQGTCTQEEKNRLDEWLKPLHPFITDECRKMHRHACDFEECVQNVLLRVVENRHKLHDVENRKAWLRHITKNVCIDYGREKTRRCRSLLSLAHGIEIPEARTDLANLASVYGWNRVTEGVHKLPPRERRVAIKLLEGFTASDVAKQFSISARQMSRLMGRIREQLPTLVDLSR